MEETIPPNPNPQNEAPREAPREPMFNAPLIVIGMALLLVGLYGATSFLDRESLQWLYLDYQLDPRRFWAADGATVAYGSAVAKYRTLVSVAFLHGNWMHVIMNAGMLLAFGTPVARSFGYGVVGTAKWFAVFFGAVIAGSIAYLLMNFPPAIPSVGASGGVSGLMAAAMLVAPDGTVRSPLSRGFVTFTAIFAVANVVIVLAGPYVFGALVSWEAHAGGYLAGAIIMLLLGPRLPRYGGMDRGFELR